MARSLLKKGTDRSVHAEDCSSNQMFTFWDRVVCPLFQQAPRIAGVQGRISQGTARDHSTSGCAAPAGDRCCRAPSAAWRLRISTPASRNWSALRKLQNRAGADDLSLRWILGNPDEYQAEAERPGAAPQPDSSKAVSGGDPLRLWVAQPGEVDVGWAQMDGLSKL
jgi:hypothetical protein